MKKRWPILFAILVFPFVFASSVGDEYIIISWNDLGMHCSNKDFSKFAVLPPYNNLKAQVIKKGTATTLPEVVTTGVNVQYSIPGNTYSVGKTNFWSYSQQLFGVTLAPNIGLTGVGLTGVMLPNENYLLSKVFQSHHIPTITLLLKTRSSLPWFKYAIVAILCFSVLSR